MDSEELEGGQKGKERKEAIHQRARDRGNEEENGEKPLNVLSKLVVLISLPAHQKKCYIEQDLSRFSKLRWET